MPSNNLGLLQLSQKQDSNLGYLGTLIQNNRRVLTQLSGKSRAPNICGCQSWGRCWGSLLAGLIVSQPFSGEKGPFKGVKGVIVFGVLCREYMGMSFLSPKQKTLEGQLFFKQGSIYGSIYTLNPQLVWRRANVKTQPPNHKDIPWVGFGDLWLRVQGVCFRVRVLGFG